MPIVVDVVVRRCGLAPLMLASCLAFGLTMSPMSLPAEEPTEAELGRAEALATEARMFFKSKLYKDAAIQFMEAFALSRRPALVYNAARAYEEGGMLDKSVALFGHYERLPDVDEDGRKAAAKRRLALSAIVDKRRAEEKARQDDKAKQEEAAKRRAAAAAARKEREHKARLEDDRKRAAAAQAAIRAAAERHHAELKRQEQLRLRQERARERVPIWRTVGAGTAFVAGGVFYLQALDLAGQMSAAEVKGEDAKASYQQLESDARLWQGLAIGAAVVGVGVGAWAAWDWLADEPATSGKSSASWIVMPASDGGVRWTLHLHY